MTALLLMPPPSHQRHPPSRQQVLADESSAAAALADGAHVGGALSSDPLILKLQTLNKIFDAELKETSHLARRVSALRALLTDLIKRVEAAEEVAAPLRRVDDVHRVFISSEGDDEVDGEEVSEMKSHAIDPLKPRALSVGEESPRQRSTSIFTRLLGSGPSEKSRLEKRRSMTQSE